MWGEARTRDSNVPRNLKTRHKAQVLGEEVGRDQTPVKIRPVKEKNHGGKWEPTDLSLTPCTLCTLEKRV